MDEYKKDDGDISKYGDSLASVNFSPKRVLIDFRELKFAVRVYANNNFDGNFNEAVRDLISAGLRELNNKQGKK